MVLPRKRGWPVSTRQFRVDRIGDLITHSLSALLHGVQTFGVYGVEDGGAVRRRYFFACRPLFPNAARGRLDGHTVDIDRASFGYQVVEVETMSTKGAAEIASAGDGIAKLAGSLGILKEPHPKHPVKVECQAFFLFPFFFFFFSF